MYYPSIDPIIFSVGPLAIRWYGLAYLLAFALAWYLGIRRAQRDSQWRREEVGDLIFYGALGAVIGGRVGYVFFYAFDQLLADPLFLFKITQGGMSFHGGLLGVVLAVWLYGRKLGRGLLQMTDFGAPLVPLGLGLGRLGNFVNVELPGRPTDAVFGMIYPCGAVRDLNATCIGQWEAFARHPSPLYQAFAEGVVLFALLWWFARHPRPRGAVAGMFVAGYGALRFITEHFREPDQHIGYLAFGWLTMGQLLSLPMVVFGLGLLLWAYRGASARPART